MNAPPGAWEPLRCACGKVYELKPSAALRRGEPVDACAVCGYAHLHLRKDFPRQLGLAIVGVAAILCFTPITPPGFFWLPLVVASVIDLLLYQVIPWKVVCYVCSAEYAGQAPRPGLAPFDLHEATELARLKWPKVESVSAPPA
jgi:hypothetical protein